MEFHLTAIYGVSRSVTCHPTQVNKPRLNPSQTGRYIRLTYPEGWKAELT